MPTLDELVEYGTFFFNKVIARAVAAGASAGEYAMPAIEVVPLSRIDDERRISQIEKQLEETEEHLREEASKSGDTNGILTSGIKSSESLEPAVKEELKRLKAKLPIETGGAYTPETDIIRINEMSFENPQKLYDTLSHELLHAIRERLLVIKERVSGYTELEKWACSGRRILPQGTAVVEPEVVEFNPLLSGIIMRDVCLDHPKYGSIGANVDCVFPKMSDLRQSHSFIQGDIDTTILACFGLYQKCVAERKKTEERRQEFTPEHSKNYQRLLDYIKRVKASFLYLNVVLSFASPSDFSFMLDSCEDTTGSLWRNSEWKTAYLVLSKKNSDQNKYKSYNVAKLAIGENQECLAQEWPRLLFLPGSEIEATYIAPIRDQIEQMRHLSRLQKLKCAISRRRLQRLIKSLPQQDDSEEIDLLMKRADDLLNK
ncbi:MAG: hypothetical protein V1659_01910 [Candidatus Woesearchaeota archaeon]